MKKDCSKLAGKHVKRSSSKGHAKQIMDQSVDFFPHPKNSLLFALLFLVLGLVALVIFVEIFLHFQEYSAVEYPVRMNSNEFE